MKESYWGYWLVMLGILVIGVMLLVNSTTTGTTQDYYELKETTSAAMVDAVDYSYYRLYGDIKIAKEKFIENFIRRFSESATMTKKYNISFYDIQEVPPKVSVKISSVSNSVNVANSANSFDLVNKIDMLLLAGDSNGTTPPGSDPDKSKLGMCKMDIDITLAKVFKELLKDGSTSLIPQNLATNILNAKAKLSNLTKWAKKDEELTGTEGQTRDSMGLFVVYDPTRPQEAGHTFNGYDDEKYIEYRESGILGYAYYNREWISHD